MKIFKVKKNRTKKKIMTKHKEMLNYLKKKRYTQVDNLGGAIIIFIFFNIFIDIFISLSREAPTFIFLLFIQVCIITPVAVKERKLSKKLTRLKKKIAKNEKELASLNNEPIDVKHFYDVYLNELIKLRSEDRLSEVDHSLINEILDEKRRRREVKNIHNTNDIILDSFLKNEYENIIVLETSNIKVE